jgi:DNA-binding YbaB/EbfC family protein
MKQAMEMVSKMKKIQKELEKTDIDVESGKGEVKVIINGVQKVKEIKLDPEYLANAKPQDIEKTIVKTLNSAIEKSQKLQSDQLKSVTGGMNIPGLF